MEYYDFVTQNNSVYCIGGSIKIILSAGKGFQTLEIINEMCIHSITYRVICELEYLLNASYAPQKFCGTCKI